MNYFLRNRNINPDVIFEIHNYNITTMDNFTHFMDRIRYVKTWGWDSVLFKAGVLFVYCIVVLIFHTSWLCFIRVIGGLYFIYHDYYISYIMLFIPVMGGLKRESLWIWSWVVWITLRLAWPSILWVGHQYCE